MVKNKLVGAVKLALAAGTATAALPADEALAQQLAATAAGPAPDAELQEVVVTGSHVRRVDVETASPVLVLDNATIQQSGAVTLGDLISRIPSIAGAATNPQVNNGGGFGESNIELRGLDAARTLILLDGRRINILGASDAVDVNMIPLNLIDHVDVLKEGAGAVYGSDAIAGVVNFVTRKDVTGLELTGDWGETTKHDAAHHDLGFVYGGAGDKWSFTFGADYNQQNELTMGQRSWSSKALYLYSGSLFPAGSSRTPTGRITLPTNLQAQFNCQGDSNTVTRITGTSGATLADYRCFNDGGPNDDHFNFQPYNLNVTPQERGSIFTKANYEINDYITAYTSIVYNHTHSAAQLAPLPFDANADNIVISKDSIYNPFGTDFGGIAGNNPNFELRLVGVGDRFFDNDTSSILTYSGIKGKIWDSGWDYDLDVSYNRKDLLSNVYGYVNFTALQNAVGPSYYAGPGLTNPTCGTPAAPISGCTPVDIFNLTSPSQVSAVNQISAYYDNQQVSISRSMNLDFNGPIWALPAGELQGAVGFDYIENYLNFQTSSITVAEPPLYLNCQISSEACSGNSTGSYNVKEAYAELNAPLLANLPGVDKLTVDLGVRYSNYSLFGDTTRGQFQVEYKPVKDLLLRGTYAQIYRAPSVSDISAAPASNSPTFNDPCAGYTGKGTALYPNLPAACVGVLPNGLFAEPQNQITGLVTSNADLKPETGDVKTAGFVFDPSFVPNLSLSADWWDYRVNNLLTTLDPNYAIQQCATTAAAEFCDLVHRYTSGPNQGQILYFQQPTFNLGQLETNGIDFSLKYLLRKTPIGNFSLEIDETHLMTYKSTPSPGAAVQEIAGTENKQFGFYAKDRGTLTLAWTGFNAEAMVTARFIGGVQIPLTDEECNAAGVCTYLGDHLPSVEYYDLTVGYQIQATNTHLRAGVLNLADKTPPISGINSFGSGSSVTDVTVYDTVGRRFYVGLTQKF
jgi:outer membrane receptor protein involved in Fe transport